MKLHGQQFQPHYTRAIEFPRPDGTSLVLTLSPLPLGFHRRLRLHQIHLPVPPARICRDSQGKPLRDETGMAVLQTDQHDDHFLRELEQYHQRVAVLVVAEALRADPTLELETPRPQTDDWRTYADDLHAELERAGWCAGDLLHLCKVISQMSNLTEANLGESLANFSNAPPEGPT